MAKKKKEKETIKEAEVTASEKEFNKLLMGMSIPKTNIKKASQKYQISFSIPHKSRFKTQ